MTTPCPTFGFLVGLDLGVDLSTEQTDAVWRAFMDVVEQRGLVADGGTTRRTWTYMIHGESSQATDLDRQAIRAWASARREIARVRIGELFDLANVV